MLGQIPKDSILDVTWVLTETRNTYPIQRKVTFYVDMVNYEITGTTGCNDFSLPISRIKNKKSYVEIVTDKVVLTNNECTKAVNLFEEELLQSLSDTKFKITTKQNKIILNQDNEKQYIFSLTSQNPLLSTIQERIWKLVQLNGNNSQVYQPYLEFDFGTNSIRGFTGCNFFTGQVIVNKSLSKLNFTNIKTKSCICNTDRKKRNEEQFITLLKDGEFSFDFSKQRLNFYNQDQLVMSFGPILIQ